MEKRTCSCGKALYYSARSAGVAAEAEFQKRGVWQKPYRCPTVKDRWHLASCRALSREGRAA